MLSPPCFAGEDPMFLARGVSFVRAAVTIPFDRFKGLTIDELSPLLASHADPATGPLGDWDCVLSECQVTSPSIGSPAIARRADRRGRARSAASRRGRIEQETCRTTRTLHPRA